MTITELQRTYEVQQRALRPLALVRSFSASAFTLAQQQKAWWGLMRGGPLLEAQRAMQGIHQIAQAPAVQSLAAHQAVLRAHVEPFRMVNQQMETIFDSYRGLAGDLAMTQALRTFNAITTAASPIADEASVEVEAATEALVARVRALPSKEKVGLAHAMLAVAEGLTEFVGRMESTGASPMATFALLRVAVAVWYIALVLGLLSDE